MNGTSVSTMTAYTAHREWATRPPDERFDSVQTLYNAARTRRLRRRLDRPRTLRSRWNSACRRGWREALEAMKRQKIRLILSDINMPNMDGLQLLNELKANDHWKNVPVLMISTDGSQAKVMEAVQLGARGFVRKPFLADQLKEKLVRML